MAHVQHPQILLGSVLGPPVVAGFTWILQRTSAYMPLYLWAFFFGLQIFFMTIYPVFIAPLFNKFSPLEKGTLRYAAAAAASHQTPAAIQVYPLSLSIRQGRARQYLALDLNLQQDGSDTWQIEYIPQWPTYSILVMCKLCFRPA